MNAPQRLWTMSMSVVDSDVQAVVTVFASPTHTLMSSQPRDDYCIMARTRWNNGRGSDGANTAPDRIRVLKALPCFGGTMANITTKTVRGLRQAHMEPAPKRPMSRRRVKYNAALKFSWLSRPTSSGSTIADTTLSTRHGALASCKGMPVDVSSSMWEVWCQTTTNTKL
ncbi:hypothetical protein BC567DRAFT_206366 [Phyllosticta citribraziliensis]